MTLTFGQMLEISRSPGLRSTKKRKKIVYGRIMPSKAGRSNLVIRVSGRGHMTITRAPRNTGSKQSFTRLEGGHNNQFREWGYRRACRKNCFERKSREKYSQSKQ
ncbi:hypothetical protein AAZV13_12G080100 [Glycine max]